MNIEGNDDEAYERQDAISLKYYIQSLLSILEHARIWPAVTFSSCKILLSTGATIIFIMLNVFLLLTEFAALAMNNNLELIANIVGVIGMHLSGLLKWCYCIIKTKKIVEIVAKLEKCHVLCQRIDNSQEGCQMYWNEMKNGRQYSNFFITWWMCLSIYGTLHWCINPLLMESWTPDQINSNNRTYIKRNLPFVGWHPWDIENINNYISLYIMQIIGGLSSALGIACFDVFYVTLLIILCAQFQYINAILMKVDSDNPLDSTLLQKKLKSCLDYHVEIIKFIKMLQTFCNPTMFMQCIETLFIICLISFEASMIQITMDKEIILKLWSLLEYFLCAAIQLYLFCFFASRLEHLGLQIAHSVYACGWELTTFEKTKQPFGKQLGYYDVDRLVQIIMIQAQRPIILRGGPFYVLSLETFRFIISMALSNSIMLRTISEDK